MIHGKHNVSKSTAQAADDFLRPSVPSVIPAPVVNQILDALDEKEVEVNAMLNDFFRTDQFQMKPNRQVDRKTFGRRAK